MDRSELPAQSREGAAHGPGRLRRSAGESSLRTERKRGTPEVESLIARREQARAAKDYAESDRIRDELAARGILLEDTPPGYRVGSAASASARRRAPWRRYPARRSGVSENGRRSASSRGAGVGRRGSAVTGTRRGEIDLIAVRDRLVVFVEVKTRTGARYGMPAEAVTAVKRGRMARVAQHYPRTAGLVGAPLPVRRDRGRGHRPAGRRGPPHSGRLQAVAHRMRPLG